MQRKWLCRHDEEEICVDMIKSNEPTPFSVKYISNKPAAAGDAEQNQTRCDVTIGRRLRDITIYRI